MLADGFLTEVQEKGAYFADQLNKLAGRHQQFAVKARGMGLIQGLVLTPAGIAQGPAIVDTLFNRGILINFAGNAVLRFIPPLVVSRMEIDTVIVALDEVLAELPTAG